MFANLVLTALLALAQDKPAAAPPDLDPVRAKAMSAVFQDLQKLQMEKLLPALKTAKKPEDAKKIVAEMMGPFTGKLINLAQEKPGDTVAFECFLGVIGLSIQMEDTKTRNQAVDLLLKHHGDNSRLGIFCQMLAGGQVEDGLALLDRIEKESKNPGVRGQAALCLAMAYQDQAESPEVPDATRKEALVKAASAFARVVKDYASEKDLDDRPLGPQAEALSSLAVGKKAPEAIARDLDGKAVKLSDHKGQVIVLDIWATWCGPCRAMIPHERKMVEKYKAKPFTLISISADETPDIVKTFLKKEPMPWVHWHAGPGDDSLVKKWNVRFFPTILVLDSKGVIRYKNVRDEELDKAVAELLAEVK
ncbi:MAG: TlpA disulfide reductase family protein [Planctomycetota bacterium]|nr:TlpA disulfide reductase family protein [Planctomycetota bacterium]